MGRGRLALLGAARDDRGRDQVTCADGSTGHVFLFRRRKQGPFVAVSGESKVARRYTCAMGSGWSWGMASPSRNFQVGVAGDFREQKPPGTCVSPGRCRAAATNRPPVHPRSWCSSAARWLGSWSGHAGRLQRASSWCSASYARMVTRPVPGKGTPAARSLDRRSTMGMTAVGSLLHQQGTPLTRARRCAVGPSRARVCVKHHQGPDLRRDPLQSELVVVQLDLHSVFALLLLGVVGALLLVVVPTKKKAHHNGHGRQYPRRPRHVRDAAKPRGGRGGSCDDNTLPPREVRVGPAVDTPGPEQLRRPGRARLFDAERRARGRRRATGTPSSSARCT